MTTHTETDGIVLAEYTAVLERGGTRYAARAHGRVEEDARWVGWLEFVPSDGPPLATDRETTQPDRDAIAHWARHLSDVYLEGALERAARAAEPAPTRPAATARELPPVEVRAVLDPFAVYAQGEEILRSELGALSPDHLLSIVRAYGLGDAPPRLPTEQATKERLVEQIMAGVRSSL